MDKSISLVHFFHSPERETGFIHFWRCKYESVPSLQTKCWNEFVWHPHLSMTTTAVLISAQILSRRDNWGLFRFSLAVWNNSFGQSIMLLSKMPAKPSQRQQKRPPGQTKALAPSLLCTSGSPLNSNWAPCSGFVVAAGWADLSGGNIVSADPVPSEPQMSLSWGHCLLLYMEISHWHWVFHLLFSQLHCRSHNSLHQADTNCRSHTINGRGQHPLLPLEGIRGLL